MGFFNSAPWGRGTAKRWRGLKRTSVFVPPPHHLRWSAPSSGGELRGVPTVVHPLLRRGIALTSSPPQLARVVPPVFRARHHMVLSRFSPVFSPHTRDNSCQCFCVIANRVYSLRHTAGGRYPVLRDTRKTCVIFHYASWLCQLDPGLRRDDDKRGIHYASCRLWRQLDPGLDPPTKFCNFAGPGAGMTALCAEMTTEMVAVTFSQKNTVNGC